MMKWNTAKSGRLIRKAADIINDKGYSNGQLQDEQGAFCIRGAVNYAWCGNPHISYNYEYTDWIAVGQSRGKRNPQVVTALTEFRDYLVNNGPLDSINGPAVVTTLGVEWFNDNNNKDEVVRWMHKFADETDPKK